jgi:kynureninase
MITRQLCHTLDVSDPLAPLRELFDLPEGIVYLDGNSLGALPRTTAEQVARVVQDEWGDGLIGSWNHAGWMSLPQRVGDKIARLVGAGPGELIVADSTSVNLYKALHSAVRLARAQHLERNPQAGSKRLVIVSEASNFPTDLYIAQSVARETGATLLALDQDVIQPWLVAHALPRPASAGRDLSPSGALDNDLAAVLLLTQVNYRSGRQHDMAALTAAAHAAGAVTVWDLAHSAGAVPVDLKGADADFAVGCGYKYLNGGPGAPAFVWAHPRVTATLQSHGLSQPLTGWIGHAAPFEFGPDYRPAAGIAGFQCGTPPVLALAALECGVDTVLAAEEVGGMAALRSKSVELAELFISLLESRCGGAGLELISPRDPGERGSQVSISCELGKDSAYPITQALIARGVVGDFRSPDVLRFGFTPLYTQFVDVYDAVEQLRQILASGEWREPRFAVRGQVT